MNKKNYGPNGEYTSFTDYFKSLNLGIKQKEIYKPYVVPLYNGGLQLEWTFDKDYFEIEISFDGVFWMSEIDGVFKTGGTDTLSENLINFLRRFDFPDLSKDEYEE